MKSIMFILLTITSTAALACPNLTGQFQCYDEEEGYYLNNVTQSGSGTNTTYIVESFGETETHKADNVWVSWYLKLR